MANETYIELHAHSNFSFLDGASHIEDLLRRAASLSMGALAVTDHDGLYGACRFAGAARTAGIKPILGAELTLEEGIHVTVLVENGEGYGNLSRLITQSQLAGEKGKPRLSHSDLAGRTRGLIGLSGCERGEVPRLLDGGDKGAAGRALEWYREIFGTENFYVELQHHLNPGDSRRCLRLDELARRTGTGTVATNNVHYAERGGFTLHDVLVCIKNRVTLEGSAALRRPNSEYYLKGRKEMDLVMSPYRRAVDRTVEIAGRCNFFPDFSSSFPDFSLPSGETAGAFLGRLARERARRKYGDLTETVAERLNHELALIESKGLAGYFLVVWDIVEFARGAGISAQGRGSAASSLVAYVLGITPVDPLRHSLFVGRFLNESAVPDIDIDIAAQRREEVLRYVYRKYGHERAAMVCTYVTFQGRNAVREVGKVLGLPASILDRMARTVAFRGGARAIESLGEIPEFQTYLGSQAWRHFAPLCARIADFPRHLSIHAGGMIVTSEPVASIVPLERARMDGRVVCQWDKDGVDDGGLIKVDLLGLRMLSLIDDAKVLVKKQRGVDLDFDSIAPDDPEVYDLIGRADTVGVFQVESRAQMQTLPKVRPRSMEDLAVQVAMIRPGPLQGRMVHPYIRRRQGLEPVVHMHPLLKPILDETLGLILFQEQILQVACEVAGFSTGEANCLRKAMGRKHGRAELDGWHERFVTGAGARGVERKTADAIFRHIGGFAEFGFCKSHAASFAILCYRSAFLKRYYSAEFYCALLNNQPMGFYIPEVIVGDARRHGVTVLPADINRSAWQCTIERGRIRIGFRYIRGMGEEKAALVVTERGKGPFRSLGDFYRRTGLERKALQHCIAVGAFDALGRSRRQLLWEAGTLRPVGLEGAHCGEGNVVPIDEMTAEEETVADYAVQGFSPSRHLMGLYRDSLAAAGAVGSAALVRCVDGSAVRIGGYRVCLQVPPTAKGFAFVTMEDEDGLINVVVRPYVYGRYRALLRLEPLLLVEGTVERKDGLINVVAREIIRIG
jgi:error-prone DNA polymerase